MSEQKNKSVAVPNSLGIAVLIVVALVWSVGLVGRGFWRLNQPSGIQPSESKQTTESKQNTESKQTIPESFAQVQNVSTGIFSYGGSTAWAPIRLLVDSAIQAERPEFQLRYVEPNMGLTGSRTGIRMLLDNRLTFAQSSHSLLEQEYDRAKQRGFTLKQIPIAIDGIAVAVNPNLNVPGLTLDQLNSIYSGRIVNWQEVGGPDLEITPYSRPTSTGGTVEFFTEEILKGQGFGSNIEFVSTTTQALRRLADNPGGIYYASAPAMVPQCKIKTLPLGREPGEFVPPYQEPFVPSAQCPNRRNKLNVQAFQTKQYPITRYLYVVVKQNGNIEEQAGEAYGNFLLTVQGQELIAKAGFVPIR